MFTLATVVQSAFRHAFPHFLQRSDRREYHLNDFLLDTLLQCPISELGVDVMEMPTETCIFQIAVSVEIYVISNTIVFSLWCVFYVFLYRWGLLLAKLKRTTQSDAYYAAYTLAWLQL